MKLEQVNAVAENVAFDYSSAKSVIKDWLKSPKHKKNILGKHSEIGIGIGTTKSEDHIFYFTNLFLE